MNYSNIKNRYEFNATDNYDNDIKMAEKCVSTGGLMISSENNTLEGLVKCLKTEKHN